MLISAAVVRETGQPFVIEELELDAPRAGEVLVKVHAVGICHTDIAVQHQWMPVPLPLVLGHEGAGVVEAVGEGVTKVAVGDKVVLTYASCGSCGMCSRGEQAYCLELVGRNVSGGRLDGTNALHGEGNVHGFFFSQSSFATHAVATERNVVKVPEDTDLTLVGPLGCGLQTGAGTVINRLKPTAGSSIAVFGTGAVGLAAVMAAKVVGCTTIIAVDIKASRLELASELGATHTVDSAAVDAVTTIQQITGWGADFTIDTTAVPAAARQAVDALAPRGTCAIVGLGPGGTEVAIDMTGLLIPGRTVTGVTEGDARPDEFIPLLLELHRQGRFPIDKMVRTYPLADINQAVEDTESGRTLKAVLLPR
jgi:aryl-alcohol dehydrogenase